MKKQQQTQLATFGANTKRLLFSSRKRIVISAVIGLAVAAATSTFASTGKQNCPSTHRNAKAPGGGYICVLKSNQVVSNLTAKPPVTLDGRAVPLTARPPVPLTGRIESCGTDLTRDSEDRCVSIKPKKKNCPSNKRNAVDGRGNYYCVPKSNRQPAPTQTTRPTPTTTTVSSPSTSQASRSNGTTTQSSSGSGSPTSNSSGTIATGGSSTEPRPTPKPKTGDIVISSVNTEAEIIGNVDVKISRVDKKKPSCINNRVKGHTYSLGGENHGKIHFINCKTGKYKLTIIGRKGFVVSGKKTVLFTVNENIETEQEIIMKRKK